MSSGVQTYQSGDGPVVEAVRFDGSNRSQIEQWLLARVGVVDASEFIKGSWCVLVGGVPMWMESSTFRERFERAAPES